tara:strand:- start:3326 stop:4225 length:900 start_codon:yes stop_codon:yes gene_type:complete
MFEKNKKYILDGGGGQTLLEMGLQPEGALWSASALIDKNLHSLVVKMHTDFIDAGSDLIVTSNFSVRKRRLKQYNKLNYFEEATKDAALLAKKAKDNSNKHVLLAGSIPTQGTVYSEEIVTNDKETYLGFYETAKILNPYVDLFYLDVLSRLKEIEIAFEAIKNFEKPILIGVHLNKDGFLPTNEQIEDLIPISKDINCCGIILACVAPEIIDLSLPKLNQLNLSYGFKVNAFDNIPESNSGLWDHYTNPVDMFGTRAKEFTPEVYKDFIMNYSDKGANLLGGCCEIKPRHIKALKNLL